MGRILLITVCSLAMAAPISLFAGLSYMAIGVFCLYLFGLSEVRGSFWGLVAINVSILSTLLTFLVLFAYFCRSFE